MESEAAFLWKRLVVFDIIDKCFDSFFLIALLPKIFNEAIKEEKKISLIASRWICNA